MKYFIIPFLLLFFSLQQLQAQLRAMVDAPLDTAAVDVFNQADIEKITEQVLAENKELEERLANLESNLASQKDVIKVLTNANKIRYEASVSTLSQRYDAGERIIYHIIKETNQFNLSFSQLLLQNEFSYLSDPTSYRVFNNSLDKSMDLLRDRKMMQGTGTDIINMLPMLNNPIISTSVSMVSFFLANYHKKGKMKTDALHELSCVLNYTNQVKTEYQLIASHLQHLNSRLEAFRDASKGFLGEYLEAIDYEGGYQQYIHDKNNLPYDFMKRKRGDFFGDLKVDVDNVGIIRYETSKDDNVLFYIEQVKFYLNEYQLLLIEIDDFIKNYEKFVASQKNNSNDICPTFNNETALVFDRINKQLAIVKDNFKIVYVENRIDKNSKRILFGF
ncbi:MAG: hypothetical protein ACPG5B_01355 [Chitinophagales bacterium]